MSAGPSAPESPIGWAVELEEDSPRSAGLPAFATDSGSVARVGLLRELPALVAAAVIVAFLLRTLVFQAFYIPSPSMGCAECPVHTLEINDKILVSKLSYRLHAPRRGDVVVFECPATAVCNNRKTSSNPVARGVRWFGEHVGVVPPSTEDYIKRVIALPGEAVEIRDGLVLVNGQPVVEPYLPPTVASSVSPSFQQPYVVPPDHLWVMGDNRGNSSDSRVFQAIPINSIVGRAIVRFWPIPRVGFL